MQLINAARYLLEKKEKYVMRLYLHRRIISLEDIVNNKLYIVYCKTQEIRETYSCNSSCLSRIITSFTNINLYLLH